MTQYIADEAHFKEVLADDPELVEAAMNQFDSVWAGFKCKTCRRKQYCGDPILK